MRQIGRRGFVLGLGLLAGACLSPTLPLPPPSKPEIDGPDAQGQVTLSGTVEGNAHVIASNIRLRKSWGYYTEDDGRYTLVIEAQVGDEVTLYYRIGQDQSPQIVFRIPQPPP